MTGRLCAIALNPPTTSGVRTTRHLEIAANIIGCESLVIVNLFTVPTKSVLEINDIGASWDGWLAARPSLASALTTSGHLLAAWGVRGLVGIARRHQQLQVEWLMDAVAKSHQSIWMLDGQPRHPSRWHQYVSDKHGRTFGGSFEDRLGQVLKRESIEMFRGGLSHPKPLARKRSDTPLELQNKHLSALVRETQPCVPAVPATRVP